MGTYQYRTKKKKKLNTTGDIYFQIVYNLFIYLPNWGYIILHIITLNTF